MRGIVRLLIVLFGLAWLAAEVPLDAKPQSRADTWRRTADGWEHARWLQGDNPVPPTKLHPLVTGLLEGLLASAVLIAIPPKSYRAAP